MAYEKTNWVNDETPLNAENMNNIEQGIENLQILQGTSAPDSTITAEIGQFYLDIAAKILYQYVGTNEWQVVGGVSQEDFDKLVNNTTKIARSDGQFQAGTGSQGQGNAIGRNSNATNHYNVAMGSEANANFPKTIQLGTGMNNTANSLQIFDKNIYNHSTDTLTVQNIELNGKHLKSHALETLTLTGDAVLTSTETFTTHTQILVEFETDGIHAGFDCILHPYDQAICMVTYNVLTNDTPHFSTCYLDNTGHVVVNVPTGMTFTNVKAHYIALE